MNTKYCPECEETKDVSKFYFHKPSGKHERKCKKCKKDRQKEYNKNPVKNSGVPHEQEIIDMLRSKGIYACSGKLMNARWVDIVAWGCVAIECKLGRTKNNQPNTYLFTFTKKQVEEGIRGDMLIFMIECDDTTKFFFLPSDYPDLYQIGGVLKKNISYTPGSTHPNTDQDWNEYMEDAEDRIELIEQMLDEKIDLMLVGEEVDKWADA